MSNTFLMGLSNLGITFDSSNENLYLIDFLPNSEKECSQKKSNVDEYVIDNPLLNIDAQSDTITE
jgi:hypothetical protein